MAKWIKANGDIKNVEPKNGNDFSLEELQGMVGGLIEIIHLSDKQLMVVNEDGKLNNLPYNHVATVIFCMAAFQPCYDYVAGDVLICKSNEIE